MKTANGRHAAGPATPDPIRVVVIDDNRLAADLLAEVLEAHAEFKVVSSAEHVKEGLAQVLESRPNVALVDAKLCRDHAELCLECVKQMAPTSRVIMMDVLPTQDDIIPFIEAGATGLLHRDASINELLGTIRTVSRGSNVVPSSLTSALWSHLTGAPHPPRSAEALLTKREWEIADLIAEGLSNKQIAHRLDIATHTVKTHVHHILDKLALHTRVQIAVLAWQPRPAAPAHEEHPSLVA